MNESPFKFKLRKDQRLVSIGIPRDGIPAFANFVQICFCRPKATVLNMKNFSITTAISDLR